MAFSLTESINFELHVTTSICVSWFLSTSLNRFVLNVSKFHCLFADVCSTLCWHKKSRNNDSITIFTFFFNSKSRYLTNHSFAIFFKTLITGYKLASRYELSESLLYFFFVVLIVFFFRLKTTASVEWNLQTDTFLEPSQPFIDSSTAGRRRKLAFLSTLLWSCWRNYYYTFKHSRVECFQMWDWRTQNYN